MYHQLHHGGRLIFYGFCWILLVFVVFMITRVIMNGRGQGDAENANENLRERQQKKNGEKMGYFQDP